MAWNSFATPLIGKAVRAASRLAHGGGSAFPGKIVERIDPQFLSRTLAQLPLGVVLVSGTNGKTTTTRMVASMLQSLGLKVFTNQTGSNFTRGVVSSLLAEVSLSGKLFEIALGDAGNRACPVIGTLFERRSGGWKSCRRRIPIIYRRNHPSPLLQSGSGPVFVADRAVSLPPYRKTISPQTTQLLFLSLSLSKIGIIDGFLSDKSIREIGKFIKYNIISDFHSDFHRGGIL